VSKRTERRAQRSYGACIVYDDRPTLGWTDDLLEGLTAREREVLELIAEGLSNKAIRERLFISAKTLERHIRHIFGKLDVTGPDYGNNPRVCAVLIWHRSVTAVG
jgi:ATP/maltotriose-dependent transcriptional regulator MalT